MVGTLSRLAGRLLGFVREVDRGIAVGYGYEDPGKYIRAEFLVHGTIRSEARRRHGGKGRRGRRC